MKIVFLHGLGQTSQDWKRVIENISLPDVECPELFPLTEGEITYPGILAELEKLYAETVEPMVFCGLSFGAVLALDYTIRHRDKISSLILIGAQYKVPSRLIDFQNLIFRCMPNRAFAGMGLSKRNTIKLSHSMRSLDFSHSLNKIDCPVTIICGENDKSNLTAYKQLKSFLPQSELHIIPGAGHEINKCNPEAISAILNDKYSDKSY